MPSKGSNQRIFVTAAGVVSGLGIGLDEFARNLQFGKTVAAPSSRFAGLTVAEIPDLNPQPWLGSKGVRALDRSARLLAIAAKMALDAAGLSPQDSETGDPDLALVCGTVFSSLHSIASFDWSGLIEGPAWVNPTDFANTVINAPAGQAAIKHKLRGVNSTICAGQASSLFALSYAADILRLGRAKAVLAGGVEELCTESVHGFSQTGVVLGEGAALLLLETEQSARLPWLELLGFGCSHEAAEALSHALEKSAIAPEQVACIISSANGDPLADEIEARALDLVFGHHLPKIPVYAPKSVLGETLGAAGAEAAVVAGLSLQRVSGEYALVNALGCDGNNASLVLRLSAPEPSARPHSRDR